MRQLLYLTTSFPFGKGEDFLTEELRHAQGFDDYLIVSCHSAPEDSQTKPVPDGMRVVRLNASPDAVSYLSVLFRPDLLREAIALPFQGQSFFGKLHQLLFFRRKAQAVYEALCSEVLPSLTGEEIVIYSYWFYDAAMSGALLAKRLRAMGKRVHLLSRAHGFDAFPERSPYGYLPMRRFLLNHYDAVRPCSPSAARAVKDAFPEQCGKVRTAFLGTADHGLPYGSRSPVFHVVTCSYLVPVKRIPLFVQALALVSFPMRWTHIGGGPQEAEVRAAAEQLPAHVEWELPGPMRNEDLMRYYAETPVSCVANVSSSEGLPVALMEACSFGFPCIATEVGGTPEAVRDGVTGCLLGKNPSPEEIASALEHMARLPEEEYASLCRAARKLWEDKFHAEKNYKLFYEELSQLLGKDGES